MSADNTPDPVSPKPMTTAVRTSVCPNCSAEITSDLRSTTWCQACDWNVDPEPAKRLGRIQRIVTRRADKLALRLFEQVRAHPESQRRGKLVATIVWLLAIAVHLVTVAMLVTAVLLALSSVIFLPFRVVGAAILVMIAGYVQPFRWRREPEHVAVTRQDAPSLFSLVDEVAAVIGAAPVHVIRLTSEFNAHYFKTRVARKGITLGLTLWSILEPQERVALIGHELGHGVNGDLRSTVLVGRALRTLAYWHLLFRPSTRRTHRRAASVAGVLVALTEDLLLPLVLIPITILIGLAGRALELIANRHGQRCEYYADELSARAAGTAGAVALCEKLMIGDTCRRVLVQAARFSRGADPWREVKAEADAIPPGEWERRRRLAMRQLNRIDVSHPPTRLRADLLRDRPSRVAAVTLTPERSAAIDAELAPGTKRVEAGVRSALGIASRIAWG